MEKSERHNLDFNLTHNYVVEEHLKFGNALSKAILKNCDFNLGTFHTILPKRANLNAIYRFKTGGIIPQDKEKKLIDFQGSKKWYQELSSTREEMIQYVEQFLRKNNEGTVVLEEVILDRKDHFSDMKNISISYTNDEVYYILKSKNSHEEISSSIKQSVEVWHYVAILIPHHIELSEDLTETQINLLSSSIQCMIVVAYDRESYIFWERNLS